LEIKIAILAVVAILFNCEIEMLLLFPEHSSPPQAIDCGGGLVTCQPCGINILSIWPNLNGFVTSLLKKYFSSCNVANKYKVSDQH